MNKKTAIIVSGGGMTCAYSAGVILALVDKYHLTKPDIVIGGSASTGTLAYYVAGQYSSIRRVWCELLPTRKLISLLRFWRFVNVDYLIDEIFCKKEPISLKRIYSSRINYLIAVTEWKTGKVEYFSNKSRDDIIEAMRASMAVPIAYNKRVCIKGKNYCDTFISSQIENNVYKAIELGAERLIIIENNYYSRIVYWMYDLWLFLQNKQFRTSHKEFVEIKKCFSIPENIKVIFITPHKKVSAWVFTRSRNNLNDTFAQGYEETVHNRKLKSFLGFG